MLDTALLTLGDTYHNDAMLDDSGMHLEVARIIEEKGELKRAAYVKRRILSERLEDRGVHANPSPAASIWRCPPTNKIPGCEIRRPPDRNAGWLVTRLGQVTPQGALKER